ncbi:hypothetical protein HZ994_14665 [Akkermansiaceae bacterium]|nr:hypothetical protein HZ994_14665 [Akkermansiaceae bacterium]
MLTLIASVVPAAGLADPGDFYTQRGTDKTFAEIMESGDLETGSNTTGGLTGSRISVNEALLSDGPNARRKIPQEINIHTLANSSIQRRDFPKWTRWYQEDGNTQVFRLFKGETNVRNARELAARVEAFSKLNWTEGKWHEWVGTYTIIKPHGAAIFQAKNNVNDWSVQLNMSDDGDIKLNHRRGEDKTIARNMTGKPFHIRVRDNGRDYEVFLNGREVGKGSYARPEGQSSFRWGMYLGGSPLRHDAMILVTGAEIDPRKIDETGLEDLSGKTVAEPAAETPPPVEAQPPEGLPIPARKWNNKEGVAITAPGVFKVGDDFVMLKVGSRWVSYSLADLAEDDRAALLQAADFVEK